MAFSTSDGGSNRGTFARNVAIVIAGLFVLYAIGNRISEAKPEVISVTNKSDTRLVNGAPDYGVLVQVSVHNRADESGNIVVKARLSTSEGEWERQQTLYFSADQTKNLEYFFSEPSVNASGIQSRCSAEPEGPF